MIEIACDCGQHLCTRKVALLNNLAPAVQASLASRALHFEAEPGETLFLEGHKADAVLIVREGKVKLNRFDTDGKEYILDIRVGGETIGEEDFFTVTNFSYNAECLTKTKLCQISKQMLMEIIRNEQEGMPLAIRLIEQLSERLHQSSQKISILMEDNAYRRIVGFLLERDERVGQSGIELTLDDIAGSTSLRRETVSRKLTELQKQGLIERHGQKKIKVTDREKLQDILLES